MEKNHHSCSILQSLNLDNIEEVLSEAYHKQGAGRPPRKPIGIFKALIIKRVKQIPSDQELYRRLWHDEDLREVCDIEETEKPYNPSQLTRFRNRVGVERLEKIMNTLIDELSLSKKALEGLLSREVDLLSLPYGSMNPDTLRCSRAAGYRMLFVNVPYPDSVKEGMRVVGRTHVAMEDWAIEYRLKLRGAYDWISVTYIAKKNIKRLFPSLARERNG